jgi:NACHT domain/Calcineurin-like phosphoesterase/HEAT repeats
MSNIRGRAVRAPGLAAEIEGDVDSRISQSHLQMPTRADDFNWLHLTDLHYGQTGQGPLWSNVRQAFFKDLAALHDRCGPWNAVLFTGDLVYSGTGQQFAQLEEDVLGRLFAELERLGSGDAVLLAVPGNHDLVRPDTRTKIPSNLRQLLRHGGIDEIAEEFWETSDTEYHQVITTALGNYSNWWDKTPWRKGLLIQPGLLPGDFATTLTVGRRRIGIVGLNTTFLQLAGGDYRGRLAWHPAQLRAVCGDPDDWVNSHDACLLLTHQAGEWLSESANNGAGLEINPAGRFAAHLFGHMHANDLSGVSTGGGPQRFLWQASSLFGMEKYGESPRQVDRRHGYAASRLTFGKRDITVRCWPRTASSDANGWRLHADHKAAVLARDESTAPETVGKVKRITSTTPKKARVSGAASEATGRALLATYLRAARGLWDIVDLAGLPEDDRHLAMQKFMLRQLYMPLRMVIEQGSADTLDDELALLDALEARRERNRLASAGRSAEGETGEPDSRISLGTWLGKILGAKQTAGDTRTSVAPRLVLVGDPGGGKSTLLRWLATACLLRLDNSADFALLPDVDTLPAFDWVPILVRCRELDKDTLGQSSLEDILRQTLPKLELSASYVPSLIALLRKRLEGGTAIFLVDGLDEIADPNQRIAFCERLEVIARSYAHAPILATSRIVGYREMRRRIGGGFVHGTLDDLTPEEKDAFVDRWCQVTTADPLRRLNEAAALRRGIHENDRVARLTGNPMLLTTMALVQRKVGRLPSRRHKLYWEAVDLLLRWRATPDEPPLDADEALPQLEYIAYAMCDRGVQRLRRDEVLALLTEMRNAYPDIRPVLRQTPEQFLAVLERRTGLLTEMGVVQHDGSPASVYEFRHLTFQEYLAALALIRGHFPGHVIGSSLALRIAPLSGRLEVDESRDGEVMVTQNWREAIRLCVASCNDDDVSSVLDAVLQPIEKAETRPRAILAAQCLADEPNVQSAQAAQILAAFASQMRRTEGLGFVRTELEFAAMELASGDWSATLETSLVREFLMRGPGARSGPGFLAGAIRRERAERAVDKEAEWVNAVTTDLLSTNDEKAAGAALFVAYTAWANTYSPTQESPIEIPPTLVPELMGNLSTVLSRGPAMAHAGAWALGWMMETSQLWRPTPVEQERLLDYLNNPDNDVEALRWTADVAGCLRLREAVPSLLVLFEASSPLLRRFVVEALVRIGEPATRPLFLNALHDGDAEIRKAALRGLIDDREQVNLRLIAGESDRSYYWHDPVKPISQEMILNTSKSLKLPVAEVRRCAEALAQELGLKIASKGGKTKAVRGRPRR